eukprot:8768997-Prorocentrum_lima.AAC.1
MQIVMSNWISTNGVQSLPSSHGNRYASSKFLSRVNAIVNVTVEVLSFWLYNKRPSIAEV